MSLLTQSQWWIREIDHRISTGIIFFVILLLCGKGEARERLNLRRAASGLILCATNFCVRFAISQTRSQLAEAFGYSMLILIMCACFALCYWLCYKTYRNQYVYGVITALTVYRLTWNTFKMSVAALGLARANLPWSGYSIANSIYSYCIYMGVIALCYINDHNDVGERELDAPGMTAIPAILIACHMALEFLYRYFVFSVAESFMYYFTAMLYCIISYGMLMMKVRVVRLQQDNELMQEFIRNKQQYYEISREGITSLQTKCHDLKHQIMLIRSAEGKRVFDRYLERLEDSINEYTTVIQCGNESIDVVLTEKNIICQSKGIKFTYMIDGKLFDFLTAMEIYAMFGNVLDNAIEGVEKVADESRRMISLKGVGMGGRILLVVENYYENEIQLRDGLPVTDKEEKTRHGFGLRSVRSIAEQHGGMISVDAQDNVFRLTVIMPGQNGET